MLPLLPFKKCKVLELLQDSNVEAAKCYVKQYFFKCQSPLTTFYWHSPSKSFNAFKQEDIRRSFLTKNMRVNDGKVKACYQFSIPDWFFQEDDDCYEVAVKTTEPIIYERDGIKYINLFSGFPHERTPYESYNDSVKENVEFILNHIKQVLCSGNEESYEYLLNWLSCVVSGRKMQSLIHFLGQQGSGKSVVSEFLQKMLGHGLVHVDDNPNVLVHWNAILKGKVLLVLEELPAQTKSQWSQFNEALKHITTSNSMTLREKFKSEMSVDNICNVMVITNNRSALKCGRRIVSFDVSNERVGDFDYFGELVSRMQRSKTCEAFMNYLRNKYDETGKTFHENRAPKTTTNNDLANEYLKKTYKYIKDVFIKKNRGMEDLPFGRFYNDFIVRSNSNLSKVSVSKDLKNIGLIAKVKSLEVNGKKTSRRVLNVTHDELMGIYEARNWIHETDEIGLDSDESSTDDTTSALDENTTGMSACIEKLKQKVAAQKEENKRLRKRVRRKKKKRANDVLLKDIKDICVN